MNVLLLCTPFDVRARLDGTRRAVADLAPALARLGVTPWVLARDPGACPPGAGRWPAARKIDVVHAFLTPRATTGWILRLGHAVSPATGIPWLLTVTSQPEPVPARAMRGLPTFVGSRAGQAWLARAGVAAEVVPLPFGAPAVPAVPTDVRAVGAYALYAGDLADEGWRWVDRAWSAESGPGLTLVVASRSKAAGDDRWAARLREAPRSNVRWLGEVDDLLPWIAGAAWVVVPAVSTRHKLDHPRVVLEALAMGTRCLVGPAPSFDDLVEAGVVTRASSEQALRTWLASCAIDGPAAPADAVAHVLETSCPDRIAREYVRIYEELRSARRRTLRPSRRGAGA